MAPGFSSVSYSFSLNVFLLPVFIGVNYITAASQNRYGINTVSFIS